jgi:hypothetical protein
MLILPVVNEDLILRKVELPTCTLLEKIDTSNSIYTMIIFNESPEEDTNPDEENIIL